MPEQVTAYKCKYCGSKFVRMTKRIVEEHEQWCYSREENKPACWEGCRHYTRGLKDEDGNYFHHYCSEHDEPMESMRMKIRRENHAGYPCNGSLMPKECEDFQFYIG